MQACSLSATDLACRRGDRLLFARLSFALGPGEALQLAGANGIGKSSLMRIVAGLMPAFAGTIERHGALGLIDERPALDPHLPLGRALAFWQRLDGPADNAAAPISSKSAAVRPEVPITTRRPAASAARVLAFTTESAV